MQDYINYDSFKEEKIDGQIYLMAAPSDEHRDVQANITNLFNDYFKKKKKRCISRFDANLYIDENNFLEPDVMVFCYNTNRNIPLIVIEVLSNSTRNLDLGKKMKKYAEIGIKEYWIVTWELFTIDIYLLADDRKYEHYKSYAYVKSEKFTRKFDEKTEIVKEFSPVSMPELVVRLEDVFYFVE
ncbi:MAG: Uma2 family endonuclease [Oscillospiraceae bacterium]|nr:Uma2 family endonuclease [Oscillospiraceae bacterium]